MWEGSPEQARLSFEISVTLSLEGPRQTVILSPLSARLSFQVWYLGGQRLEVSFSWSGVKSSSKCFSNTKPTTINASPDEKRFNTAVQWTRSVHSSHRSAVRPTCSCASTYTKTEVQNGSDIGSPKRTPKTRCFLKLWRVDRILRWITPVLTSLCFFSLGPWVTAIDSNRSRRWSEDPSKNSSLDLAIANA